MGNSEKKTFSSVSAHAQPLFFQLYSKVISSEKNKEREKMKKHLFPFVSSFRATFDPLLQICSRWPFVVLTKTKQKE